MKGLQHAGSAGLRPGTARGMCGRGHPWGKVVEAEEIFVQKGITRWMGVPSCIPDSRRAFQHSRHLEKDKSQPLQTACQGFGLAVVERAGKAQFWFNCPGRSRASRHQER